MLGVEDEGDVQRFLVESPEGPTWSPDLDVATRYDGPNDAMEAALTFGGRQVLALSLASGLNDARVE